MKKIMRILVVITFISSSSFMVAQDSSWPLRGISFFSPRSQSAHYEREIIGIHPFLYDYQATKNYTLVSFTPVYSQSVRAKRIAQALFGKDSLTIAGSMVANSANHDFLADYFGLSPAFLSTVQFKPFIRNFLLETQFLFLLDHIKRGLYCSVQAPVGFTRWHFDLCNENIFSTGADIPFAPGYQAANALPLQAPALSFVQAIAGNIPFGAIINGIQKGKITHSHTKKGFIDLSATVGFNFILEEDWHVGAYSRITAPTGSRPHSEFFFEPILGNGKHWQVAFGSTAHVKAWERFEQLLNFYIDVSFTHIFGACQQRSFDFKKNGFASRYLLLKEFDNNQLFTGTVIPAINITTLPCKVSNDLQVDVSLMFGYTYNNFVCDVGYNAWIRSKEKIALKGCIPSKRYGIKGIQNVFDPVTGQLDSTTQSTATIAGNNFITQSIVGDPAPVFISSSDLNLHSAASPLLITQKIFWYLGHSWPSVEKKYKCIPFFGANFSIEFEGINERDTFQSDKNTLSQWALFIKAGVRV